MKKKKVVRSKTHAGFWLRVLSVFAVIGFVLPMLFSARSDAAVVAGVLVLVVLLTYLFNLITENYEKVSAFVTRITG